MRYFELREPMDTTPWTGEFRAQRQWGLPGVLCPTCHAEWSGVLSYPAVDLSLLPEQQSFTQPRLEPYAKYARLAEQVRPLLPPGALLQPGCTFGPLRGTAKGRFGPVTVFPSWEIFLREDALTSLRASSIRGLVPVQADLSFPVQGSERLHELQLLPIGRLHEACLPVGRPPPCTTCGRQGFRMPSKRWLDADSLPIELDIFRLEDAVTLIIATERFVEAIRALGPGDVGIVEVKAFPGSNHRPT
ncbi:SitI6 family double-CXXCG motif immunity protein [Corallococcus soli]|nr:double-CXXCG motif protein [Corallococcus soli]